MALVAHTFRIEQETLDELRRIGNGNESLGCRIALERSRERSLMTFAWGMFAGFIASGIALLVIRITFA